jgi:O-antigen/teichoic acid export membrane protein
MLFFKKVIIKNFFNLSLNQFLNLLISFLIIPVIFQSIGAENFGLVNLSLTIVYLLSIAVTYGYNLNGPKLISVIKNDKKELEKLVNEIISIRLFLSLIICLAVFIVYILFGNYSNYWIILLSSLVILFSEAIYPIFYLQGKDEINILTILNLISKILYFFLIVFFIKNPEDSFLINLIFGLTCLFSYCFFWIIIYKKEQFNWALPTLKNLKFKIKQNFDYFTSTISSYIIFNGGIIILSNYIDDSELGQFSLSQKIGLQLRMIPVFIIQSVLQKVSILNEKKDNSTNTYINKIYYAGIYLTIFIAIFILFSSKFIILLLSGKYISYSENILIILGFLPFFAMLNFKNTLIMLVEEKKKILNYAISTTALIMVFLCFIGSYLYGGFGMCIALIFSEIFSFLIHSYLLKKEKLK